MMLLLLLSCTYRSMLGATTTSLSNPSPELQVATQHFFVVPAGPAFKGRWSTEHQQVSVGAGFGLIHLLPQRSRWFMNPPTVGFQVIEWHKSQEQQKWGTMSPFLQLTAPPWCVSRKGCYHAVSPFVEVEYSNILQASNQTSWTLGLYWSTTN